MVNSNIVLTLFSIPKAFIGHNEVIQRNAIRSWTLLQPDCEIILMGDDEGTGHAAAEFGVRHIPCLRRNEFGTPLLDHAFELADVESKYDVIGFVNADIILMDDVLEAVGRVKENSDLFLMTARRWNLEVAEPLEFSQDWKSSLLSKVSSAGKLGKSTQIDFWIYPKGLLGGMPPFAIGRVAYETWCLYTARVKSALLVDATPMVTSVHQNHDYSHVPQGEVGVGRGIEAQRNREMAGGKPYFFTIRDRTHVLSRDGMIPSRGLWNLWRGIRAAQVLPVAGPVTTKLMLAALNSTINLARDAMLQGLRVLRVR